MSETRTRQQPPVGPPLDASPSPDARDPLQESLDELARIADSLVDGLAIEEPEELQPDLLDEGPLEPIEQALDAETASPVEELHEHAPELTAEPQPVSLPDELLSEHEAHEPLPGSLFGTPPADDSFELNEPAGQQDEGSQQARRAALKETLDALSDLIDDPSPPPTSREIQVGGDRGEDISVCLDNVMTPPDATVEAEPLARELPREETKETEIAEKRKNNDPPVAPLDPSEETEVETAVAAGADPVVETEISIATESSKRSTAIWWLLAIVVVIAALATSYWVLNSRSAAPVTPTRVEVPVPDPPVVYTKRSRITDSAQETGTAEPTTTPVESIVQPVETAPVAEVVLAETPVIAPVVTKPVQEPAPEIATSVTETVELAPENEVPERATGRTLALTPTVIGSSRGKTTQTGGAQPQTAGILDISMAEITQPFEPQVAEPVAAAAPNEQRRSVTVEPVLDDPTVAVVGPAITPPVLVDRIEPVFNRRSLRRGETQVVVLRVLVDERGRVVRVVVDESEVGSDAESAAINAVLRWTYDPALGSGEPVRSWTTGRFEFSRPD